MLRQGSGRPSTRRPPDARCALLWFRKADMGLEGVNAAAGREARAPRQAE
jgi:hypothetical protein